MTNKGYRFYRNQISSRYWDTYDFLEKGLNNSQQQIKLDVTNRKLISDLVEAVVLDNPMIYHQNGIKYIQNFLSWQTIILPNYILNSNEKQKNDVSVCKMQKVILNKISYKSSLDILLSLHDLFCKNITYDNYGYYSHTVYGALVNKRAVCDGIAKSFKLCCDELGIECIIVNGKVKSNLNSNFENHTWNKVKLNGCWYNIDVTFDLTIGQYFFIRHDYFLVSDKEIATSHRELKKTISCKTSGTFYESKGLLMISPDALCEFVVQNYRVNEEFNFEFQIPKFLNVKKIDEKILASTIESILKRCKINCQMYISVNKERLSAFIHIC